MSKFGALSGEGDQDLDAVLPTPEPWPSKREGTKFMSLTAAQLLEQLPKDTRWPEPIVTWDLLSEVYDVPGDRWIMGVSEIEIDTVKFVALYTVSSRTRPDGSENNASHLNVTQLRRFLSSQPGDRRVLGVLDHEELRTVIGSHICGNFRTFVQMGPFL